eukprot:gene24791-biopygen16450
MVNGQRSTVNSVKSDGQRSKVNTLCPGTGRSYPNTKGARVDAKNKETAQYKIQDGDHDSKCPCASVLKGITIASVYPFRGVVLVPIAILSDRSAGQIAGRKATPPPRRKHTPSLLLRPQRRCAAANGEAGGASNPPSGCTINGLEICKPDRGGAGNVTDHRKKCTIRPLGSRGEPNLPLPVRLHRIHR